MAQDHEDGQATGTSTPEVFDIDGKAVCPVDFVDRMEVGPLIDFVDRLRRLIA